MSVRATCVSLQVYMAQGTQRSIPNLRKIPSPYIKHPTLLTVKDPVEVYYILYYTMKGRFNITGVGVLILGRGILHAHETGLGGVAAWHSGSPVLLI